MGTIGMEDVAPIDEASVGPCPPSDRHYVLRAGTLSRPVPAFVPRTTLSHGQDNWGSSGIGRPGRQPYLDIRSDPADDALVAAVAPLRASLENILQIKSVMVPQASGSHNERGQAADRARRS
jgi:hypothetical protein